jgi:predicted alpha/beta superfamily hydrolase
MDRSASVKCSTILIATSLFLLLATAEAPGQSLTRESIPPVTIAGTELRSMHSDLLGEDLDLYINLPGNYRDTSRTFPVIYLLDGQWDFTLLQAIYGEQYYDGFLPALVIVGITWSGKNPNHDSLRRRDFTPSTIVQDPSTGNGEKFPSCITRELIPFIQSHYRVTNDRALMGSSLGGLFALYAMFQETGVFQHYVLTSPALDWDNRIIGSIEKEYAGTHSDLRAKLFMGIGGLEGGIDEFEEFAEKLHSRNYAGLDLHTLVIQDAGHSGGKAEGYTRGLQAVFAPPSLRLDSPTLRELAGTYRMSPDISVKIEQRDSMLILRDRHGNEVPLHAASDHEFYAKGFFLKLRFEHDKNTTKMNLTIEQYSEVSHLTRNE